MSEVIGLCARWTLVQRGDKAELMDNATVVVDGARIVAILPNGTDAVPERTIDLSKHLLMPGFINSHTHCVSGPLFRGLLEDRDFGDGGSIIRDVMIPLGEIVSDLCNEDDIRAIARLGQFEALRTGSTSIVDMPRTEHDGAAAAAEELGLRAWLHPYIMSGAEARWSLDADGESQTDNESMAGFERWHARFDGGTDGRIRIGLGPHAPDTCAPSLLRRVARATDTFDAPVTIHLCQSVEEIDVISARLGMSPVQYLDAVGLLQPGLLAAHCVHASPEDLDLLAERDVTIAHCPLSFARIATLAPRSRFVRHAVRSTIGSDAHALDIVADLRLAAINSKYDTNEPGIASAWEMVEAATVTAADALNRADLGRIARGATADLIAVQMDRAHLQPVFDPIKSLVWNGSGQDVDFAMVSGEVLMRGGQMQRGMSEGAIVAQAAAVLDRAWERARENGVI